MIDPILITGCARSGTSMIAGSIHTCGAFGGVMSGITAHNKRGMFENSAVRNTVVKPLLRGLGVDPMGQNPLPDISRCRHLAKPLSEQWRRRVEQIFIEQGYKDGDWFYKGAKICLMWPIWRTAFPEAKWIIVRRRDEDIIASCLRTGFMRAYKNAVGWQRWIDVHKERFEEMGYEGLQVKEVWPEMVVKGDLNHLRGVIEWCGLEWNETGVKDFVAPALWRQGAFVPAGG